MAHVARGDRGTPSQSDTGNLGIAKIDLSTTLLTLGGKSCGSVCRSLVERENAAIEIVR